MAQQLLNLKKVNPGFNQVGGKTVAKMGSSPFEAIW